VSVFRTTANIFVDNREYFESKWFDSDKLVLPKRKKWDYKRELQIEDVDIWEVILETGPLGVYAAWDPYAEFYLVRIPPYFGGLYGEVLTFYGPGSQQELYLYLKKKNIELPVYQTWVDDEDIPFIKK